jgi:hypothetical protein
LSCYFCKQLKLIAKLSFNQLHLAGFFNVFISVTWFAAQPFSRSSPAFKSCRDLATDSADHKINNKQRGKPMSLVQFAVFLPTP